MVWGCMSAASQGRVYCFGGPQLVFPEGPPSVDFAIDSGIGMGIIYLLSILIWYLSIQLSILLSIIWCKNKWCKKMLKMSSYFITAVYKCLQANRKRHIKHIFLIKKPFKEREREISSACHSTTYVNIMCIEAQQNVIENSGVSSYFYKRKFKYWLSQGAGVSSPNRECNFFSLFLSTW